MSIIERAIDKASGVKSAPSSEPVEKKAADEARDNLVEAFRPEPKASQTEQPSTADDRAESEVAPEAAPSSAASTDKSTNTNVETLKADADAASEAANKNYVHIDLERLAAASFLTPDAGVSSISEEYQQIKRRLLGNMVPGMAPNANSPNLIMVTSSVPSEGKTFTSVNLSMSIAAEIDHTVLAIDTDIAKRDLTRTFNALGQPGIFDVLSDDSMDLSDVILRTNIPNFVLIPAGLNSDGSTELLASARMNEICQELATRYHDRVVIFDTPPVLATSAALALTPKMGQVVLVVEAGKTKQETLSEALGLIGESRITGLVLNKSKQQRRSAYDYYGYYYQAN